MRPLIIGIGGSSSKVGKTTLACRLLKTPTFRGWGAIKYTKTSLYSSIIDDHELLKDKDTGRLIKAGAESVLWVRSPYRELHELLEIATQRLSHLKGVIIEGNSAIEVLRPDIVIFICKGAEFKSSAEAILRMADIVIGNLPPEKSSTAKSFNVEDVDSYINFIRGLIGEKEDKRPS